MQRLADGLDGQPFAVLAVNYGESSLRVGEFIERWALRFPVLLDPGQDAARAWRVRVLPTSFLVGRDGRVRYSVVGDIDWTGAHAVETVRAMLR